MGRLPLAAIAVISIFAVTVGPSAHAQAGGGWDPADIQKMAKAYLESLPTSKLKLQGITLEYKKVPGDPKEVAREVADEQYKGMITALSEQVKAQLVSFLEEAGTLETARPITYKKKGEEVELPPGEYEFGIYVEEGVPKYAGIFGEGLEEPLRLPLKVTKKVQEAQTLQLQGKLKKSKLDLSVAWAHHVVRLPTLKVGDMPEKDDSGGEAGGEAGGEEGGEEGDDGKTGKDGSGAGAGDAPEGRR